MQTNQPTTATERFRERVLATMEQYERESAAENTTNEDHDDPLSRRHLRWLAKQHHRADLDQAEAIAEAFTLLDVRVLRTAAEAVATATPAIVMKHVGEGMEPPQIAKEIGLTPSRVYGIIREERRKETRAIIAAGVANDPNPEASYEKWKQVLATTTDPAEREQAEAFLAEFRAVIDAAAPDA